MIRRVAALALCLASLAPGTAPSSPAATARLAQDLDVAHCFDVIHHGATLDTVLCPSVVLAAVREVRPICAEAGGILRPATAVHVWVLDLRGNGVEALAFEVNDVVECENAWSVFECGSLGCPKALYEKHSGEWRSIAAINAASPEAVQLLESTAVDGYRGLRVGCAEDTECAEYAYYAWTGQGYEVTHLMVRGHRIEFRDSVHGLRALRADTTVLATPAAKGRTLERYPAGTEVVLIGTTLDGKYYYVSPCNACESGFVQAEQVVPER